MDGFVDFLKASRFDIDSNLEVNYVHRKSRDSFHFPNLYCAFEKYIWNKKDYVETKIMLDAKSKALKGAFKEGNEANFIKACIEILEWGKVNNPHTVKKMSDPSFFLFVKNLEANTNLNFIGNGNQIFSNAGFTKIYSLLFDNWVIYDSRVAAGLQHLISLYMRKNNLQDIPTALNLATPASRGDKHGDYRTIGKFKKTYSNPQRHLESNIRANYILSQYFVNNPDTRFAGDDRMRKLEAALFMIGYDLNNPVTVKHASV